MQAEFVVKADQLKFTTQTNGDHIEISRIKLSAVAAANLASMINSASEMTVKIEDD